MNGYDKDYVKKFTEGILIGALRERAKKFNMDFYFDKKNGTYILVSNKDGGFVIPYPYPCRTLADVENAFDFLTEYEFCNYGDNFIIPENVIYKEEIKRKVLAYISKNQKKAKKRKKNND